MYCRDISTVARLGLKLVKQGLRQKANHRSVVLSLVASIGYNFAVAWLKALAFMCFSCIYVRPSNGLIERFTTLAVSTLR